MTRYSISRAFSSARALAIALMSSAISGYASIKPEKALPLFTGATRALTAIHDIGSPDHEE